nr:uncharacterized protein LOC109173928 [Ipomoea trifida]
MDRSWMYRRRTQRGDLNPDFVKELETFIQFACSKPDFMDGSKIRCPCIKCHHIKFEEAEIVRYHLCKFGFVPNYFEWNRHGEMSSSIIEEICTKRNDVWNFEGNKKKSELGKRNKGGIVLDGVAQSTHTTRSTLHPKVVIQQEEQLCPRPFYFELSKRTHTKKHDVQTFIVEKDKQIHEQVELQRGILTQNGEDIDESQLYYDVVGRHDKKRRVYELDSKSQQSDNANSSKMQDDI